jgi:RNA-directed DNA polymerase
MSFEFTSIKSYEDACADQKRDPASLPDVSNLKLQVKDNYHIFPIDAQPLDFLGYEFHRGYTLLRKSIKQRFARAVAIGAGPLTLASYWGWAKHCNSSHLMKKLFNQAA